MKNPLSKNGMYTTPENLREVLAVINRIPAPERGSALIAVTMALNYCYEVVDNAIKSEGL
tara:strand:+ start:332 stop:511 length:180 start_codon:yes stop_codon:yes gene_type:complete